MSMHVGLHLYSDGLFSIHVVPARPAAAPPAIRPLTELNAARFERPDILKRLAVASRQLAELKGVAASMPNQDILIRTLGLQEAKDSSAIENIITTHDELFRNATDPRAVVGIAAKEVTRYRSALQVGFEAVQRERLLTNRHILQIQAELERNDAGFRKLPGTALKDGGGRTIYTPPQDAGAVTSLMGDLERFVNDDAPFDADPLIKMALVHHQFESIHPFYDGNGRTGRIVNVLYLVKEGLLDTPVLYMSRHIVRHKSEYYRLLQAVREDDAWEDWVLYMLTAVQQTAAQGIATIQAIKTLTFGQWDALEERLDEFSHEPLGRRRARAIRWLYATGLRLAEMAGAHCGDLQQVDYRLPDGKEDTGWMLSVVGKGDKLRQVPVPAHLVEELQGELDRNGLEADVRHESNRDVAILTRFERGVATPWSASGLAKGIKEVLESCAASMEIEDAKQLRTASTHWFRHTHGSHALTGRPGGKGVPIQVVQNNLGHASIGTTSGYLTTERDARLAAMKGFGEKNVRRR
jgi:Fic family protein